MESLPTTLANIASHLNGAVPTVVQADPSVALVRLLQLSNA